VLVSTTVRDLVVGSGISFSDRGPHKLKGVPGEWQLFAVDQIEAPLSTQLVPDTREQRFPFADTWTTVDSAPVAISGRRALRKRQADRRAARP
jgi:hypothetical protein